MKKQKIISKGYTLSVTSWENDGDNYKTESMTFESKELAIAVANLCKTVFVSKNNGKGGIGNTGEGGSAKAREIIISYMEAHPELYPEVIKHNNTLSEDELVDICMEYNSQLMGSSEYYYSRVFESCNIIYSPEDVCLEQIKF